MKVEAVFKDGQKESEINYKNGKRVN